MDLVIRHPEAWWGVFWLPAFYVSMLIVLGYAWSVWTDVQAFAPPAAPAWSPARDSRSLTGLRYSDSAQDDGKPFSQAPAPGVDGL